MMRIIITGFLSAMALLAGAGWVGGQEPKRMTAPFRPAVQPVYKADAFVDFIGINGNPFERVIEAGQFKGAGPHYSAQDFFALGIRHYRAGLKHDLIRPEQPRLMQEAYDRYGAQAMLLLDPHKLQSPEEMVRLLKQYGPGVVDLVEGPNEVNNKFPPQELNLRYKGKLDEAAGAEYQRDYYRALKADPATARLGFVAFTAIFTDYRDARPCTEFDFGNMHSYQGTEVPESSIEKNMVDFFGIYPAGAVIKPFIPTECGYNVSENGGADGRGTERAQARNLPMLLAEYFRHGMPRAYLFAMHNADGYGLLDSRQQKRPAYYALLSFISMVRDAAWNAAAHQWQGPAFTPRVLDFSLRSAPPTVHTLVLQKSNGEWYLLIWNQVRNYNAAARQDITNAPVPVLLHFETGVQPIATGYVQTDDGMRFQPEPIPVGNGTVQIQVPDSVMVIRLRPTSFPAQTPPPKPEKLAAKASLKGVALTWAPSPAATNTAGYFVYRNQRFLRATTNSMFLDDSSLVLPGLGYTYEVQAYDDNGWTSPRVATVVVTEPRYPDLVATDVRMEPATPKPGEEVRFLCTVKNQGDNALPAKAVVGIAFHVDGQFTSWGTTTQPLPPGASAIVRANGGPQGTPLWKATEGAHTLRAIVDDQNRIPRERSKYNNTLDRQVFVGVKATGELIGRCDPLPGAVDLSAEGDEDWIHWGLGGKEKINHKRGGGKISALVETGQGHTDLQPGCPTSIRWRDGEPTAECAETHAGLWWNGVGHGQEFSVPAETNWMTLRVYVSGLQSGARLVARLSDQSAPDYVSSTFARGGCDNNIIYQGPFSGVYTIRYRAASAGQKLAVRWTLVDEQNRFLGQAQLQAATLSRNHAERP